MAFTGVAKPCTAKNHSVSYPINFSDPSGLEAGYTYPAPGVMGVPSSGTNPTSGKLWMGAAVVGAIAAFSPVRTFASNARYGLLTALGITASQHGLEIADLASGNPCPTARYRTLYRNVGQNELKSIQSTRPWSFKPGPNGAESKWFSGTLEEAQAWAKIPFNNPPGKQYTLVSAKIPEGSYIYLGDLPGEGTVYVVHMTDFEKFVDFLIHHP